MQEVVTDELQVLKEPDSLDAGIKLLGSRKIGKKEINAAVQLWPLANVGTMSAASSARCQDGTIHVGDVVLSLFWCWPTMRMWTSQQPVSMWP